MICEHFCEKSVIALALHKLYMKERWRKVIIIMQTKYGANNARVWNATDLINIHYIL
jgi:hypothetical protein